MLVYQLRCVRAQTDISACFQDEIEKPYFHECQFIIRNEIRKDFTFVDFPFWNKKFTGRWQIWWMIYAQFYFHKVREKSLRGGTARAENRRLSLN